MRHGRVAKSGASPAHANNFGEAGVNGNAWIFAASSG
jgi:hypothetical protein